MRIFALVLFFAITIAFLGQKALSTQNSTLVAKASVSVADAGVPSGDGGHAGPDLNQRQPEHVETAAILFQSADGGQSWQDLNQGLPKDLQVSALFAQDGIVYLGTNSGDLYYSSNPEMGFWEQDDVEGVFSNISELAPNEPILGIYHGRTGPYVSVHQRGFFRKNATTHLWDPMGQSLEEKEIHSVLETPDGNILVGSPSGIYKSGDDGKSWKHVLSEGRAASLVQLGDVMLCSGSKGLMRSTDGGDHWECVLADKETFYRISVINKQFAALRMAGGWQESRNAVRLRISDDGGKTWKRKDENLMIFQNINEIKQAGEYLFCSHNYGISCSKDGGENWKLVRAVNVNEEIPETFNLTVWGQTILAVIRRGGC